MSRGPLFTVWGKRGHSDFLKGTEKRTFPVGDLAGERDSPGSVVNDPKLE